MDTNRFRELYAQRTAPSAPAYVRIKSLVSSLIAEGVWTEGDQIPSENELVSALNLSRMTINRAYRELVNDGKVERFPGLGTFVSTPKVSSPLFSIRNVAEEVAERGHRFHAKVEFVREERLPREDRLRTLFRGDRAYHSLIVHYEESTPLQMEDRMINPDAAPDYLEQDFTRTTPNEYLTAVAPLTRGEHIVEAVMPTTEERELLEMSGTEPCLLISRLTWSKDLLVSSTRLLLAGTRSRLEGSFSA